ncbi:hypothetical protein EV421DRAFT_1901259 [Armillaria borealis]|uniref:Uncharacterized protein n=1 Tax=Armillaria borealis TaxID=47425 RepID=A0AA39JQN8_9AGAR|nr:hypothetical protein EV421DRAFT_1901259 [Armillaria borealis]
MANLGNLKAEAQFTILCRPTEDEIIKQAGRWFARSLDPFINVKNTIVVSMKVRESAESDEEGEEEGEEDAVPPVSADEDENELMELEDVEENPYIMHICLFSFLTASFSTTSLMHANCWSIAGDDLTQLNKLLKALQASSNSAHSDDTGKVLPNTLKLLKHDRKHAFKEPVPEHKSEFGFNHEDIARFLIPIDDKSTFDSDPAGYMEAVLNGEPEKPMARIFQGYVLVRFFCHIFLGNGLPERQGKTNGRDTVATRHGMTAVTGHHIAYAATQARYCIGTVDKWQQFDGGFDLWQFFWSIVDFFEGEDKDDSAEEILSWWNKEVFSTCNAMKAKEEKSSAPPPTSCYAVIQQECRQAKKLRNEAKAQDDRQLDQAMLPHTIPLPQRPAPSQQQPPPASPSPSPPSPQHQRPILKNMFIHLNADMKTTDESALVLLANLVTIL